MKTCRSASVKGLRRCSASSTSSATAVRTFRSSGSTWSTSEALFKAFQAWVLAEIASETVSLRNHIFAAVIVAAAFRGRAEADGNAAGLRARWANHDTLRTCASFQIFKFFNAFHSFLFNRLLQRLLSGPFGTTKSCRRAATRSPGTNPPVQGM